jgi:PAS domain S-box-containing protein
MYTRGMSEELVSQARELRQQLLEQDERLRLALEAANLGTWEHVPGTHALHWDARAKAIFGLGPEDTLDFDAYVASINPLDLEGVYAGMGKATDPQGSGRCTLEYRIHTRDGRERWVEAQGRCVFADGMPQRINGTLLDITERKQAEETVRETVRRKDEFLAVLGHELRNPLAPIRTALDLMAASYPEYAVREREVIDRQLRHVTRLVDDLLDLARVTSGSLNLKREPSDLTLAVQRAVEIASPLFEAKRHRLSLSIPPAIKVFIDPVRFSQIVANLLTNAAKFSPEGGKVTISAVQQDSEMVLEVTDSGVGIEVDQLERIFEPFVQARNAERPSYGGLGLGLSLVRDLVRLHGGRVEAFSAGLGQGSRFTITVPLALDTKVIAVKRAVRSDQLTATRRILVVDDNEDAAEMLSLVLTKLGHTVRIANDGVAALALAPAFEPDVAVLDLGLPIMDGFELAGRLRHSRASALRLIAVTGYGQAEDRARTAAAGFAHHLVKPVDIAELEAALA